MKSLLRPFRPLFVPLAARLIARLLRVGGVYTHDHFRYWEAQGFHITPVHFYQPIPDTRELAARYPGRSDLPGIAWQPGAQLALLRDVLATYAPETADWPAQPGAPDTFYLHNGMFVGIDPHLYHSMVRHFRPRTIIEVGAGFSTLVAAGAVARNAAEGHPARLIAVEPYPRDFIRRGAHAIEHSAQRAEDLDPAFFDQLAAGDMLFIDSSHVVRTGGDVVYLLLEVLPRLQPGVIVHLHDIFLPEDYPSAWTLDKGWFWTEQYLLRALLVEHRRAEVLLGAHWLERDHPDTLREVFPTAGRWTGASLWLRL